jgi:hypothetical protein
VGDRAVLLAFDIDPAKTKNLAGFAVQVTPEGGQASFLVNRLSFENKLTKTNGLNDGPATAPSAAKYVSSYDAPIQMFHWVHFPPESTGKFTYVVTARYFAAGGALKDGGKVSLDVVIDDQELANLAVGMTRGYVSSQAFIDKFASFDSKGAAQLWPTPQTIDFPTAKYEKVYQYLGAHGRKMVFDFLAMVQQKKADLDIFAYDFNEPDVIRAILAIRKAGATVRLYLDDSVSHAGPTAKETAAAALMTQNGVEVKRGHFTRFAHDKVLIMKENGKATHVLTGSANFSLRGLYVQANSVLVFNDAAVADEYEQVFDATWNAANQFKNGPLAAQWFNFAVDGSPLRISFAPHKDPFPLTDVANAINSADSSVLFAVMTASGGGAVISALDVIGTKQSVLSLGTIESSGQLSTFKGDPSNSDVVSFAYLKAHTPPPFNIEVDAGMGQHIHHKYVVCDFNSVNPVVFCGSSNLSGGGETNNGDNLLAIYDRRVATAYAVEAIRLFDHYRFRSVQAKATAAKPLTLSTDDSWAKPFYDESDIRFRERQVLVMTKVTKAQILKSGPTLPVKAKPSAKKPAAAKKPGVRAKRTKPAPKRAR